MISENIDLVFLKAPISFIISISQLVCELLSESHFRMSHLCINIQSSIQGDT